MPLFEAMGEGNPAVHIPLTDTDDQTEIRFDHFLTCLFVPRHDPLAQLLLLLNRPQCRVTNLAQVTLKRVQSFRATTRFLFSDERLVHPRSCSRVLVVMVDDVSACLTKIA